MSISDKLKYLRKQKGLTQMEFAKAIGVGQQTVSGWENGVSEPNFSIMKKLVNFFGVSMDYFKDNGEITLNEDIKKDSVTELLEKLIKQGKIKTPEDIEGDLADLILYAVKMDAQLKLIEQDE